MTVTKDVVQEIYTKCLEEAQQIFPLQTWIHQPSNLEYFNNNSAYAMANAKGTVFINEKFLGTNSYNQLKSSIMHELAHLVVGVYQKHNRNFKYANRRLQAGIDVSHEEVEAIRGQCFKYEIVAVTKYGQYIIKSCNRKTKKYTNYNPEVRKLVLPGKGEILSFKYIEFGSKVG